MRVLVISDIHANIDALEAIDEKYDRLLCLGDIVDYGPEPVACLEALQGPMLRVRGNHDNAVAFHTDCGCGEAFRHLSVETRQYMWQVLGERQTSWLGEAEPLLETMIDGKRIYAVHAAPSDPLFKYLPPDTPEEELLQEASLADADIILMGHTHKPFLRQAGDKLMVNAGSVGQPRDGIPRASYAIIEDGRVSLHRTEYDIERAVARIRELPLDELAREQLAYILVHATSPHKKPWGHIT
ncbi:MAG: metallophosphoesterase family protein [Thermoleophilia bacterium]